MIKIDDYYKKKESKTSLEKVHYLEKHLTKLASKYVGERLDEKKEKAIEIDFNQRYAFDCEQDSFLINLGYIKLSFKRDCVELVLTKAQSDLIKEFKDSDLVKILKTEENLFDLSNLLTKFGSSFTTFTPTEISSRTGTGL